MPDFTQVNSYEEKILQAMNIIASDLISSIPYDKTIVCTITDDQYAAEGKYSVTNGETVFDAYTSDTTLKKNTSVYVTIPEGKFENQKMIIGKRTAETDKPYNFTMPMDTMLDITDNILDKDSASFKSFKDEDENEDTDISSNNNKMAANAGYRDTDTSMVAKYQTLYKMKESTELAYTGYTRLGVKAKFKTLLKDAKMGSYGLKITLTDKSYTTTTDDKTVGNASQQKILLLDTSDMYGNPYNFETFYSQEKVFPIDDLNTITGIKIELYQIAGSFVNDKNEPLRVAIDKTETSAEDDDGNIGTSIISSKILNNIFVDEIELCLGYDVAEVSNEYMVPVMLGQTTKSYSEFRKAEFNVKNFDLRWIHQFDDGPKRVNPMIDFIESGRLSDCEIRWYRYKLGAASADEYSGIYWQRLYVEKSGEDYILSNYNGQTIEKKSVGDNNEEIVQSIPFYGEQQALENIKFTPDTSYQTEQIKAIVFYGENRTMVRGPIITFENEETKIGTIAEEFTNALGIVCKDETYGNYFIYNEIGEMLNTNEANIEREIDCNFAATGSMERTTLELDGNKQDTISWKIPIKNSMIKLQKCGKAIGEDSEYYQLITFNDQHPYKKGTYYKKTNGLYEIDNNESPMAERYYDKKQNSNIIDLKNVWIQKQAYVNKDIDFKTAVNQKIITIRQSGEKFEYIGIEYIPITVTSNDWANQLESGLYDKNHERLPNDAVWSATELYYQQNTVVYFEITGAVTTDENDDIIPIPYYEPWNIYKNTQEEYVILQDERTMELTNDNATTNLFYPTYRIEQKYSMYNMNNTIVCTVCKERETYTSEKEFSFGVAGTMGTDQTVVIDFVGGHTAIVAGDTTTAYQLQVRMYDENNKPKDLSDVDIAWNWYLPGNQTLDIDDIDPASNFDFLSCLDYQGETITDGKYVGVSGSGKTEVDLRVGVNLCPGYTLSSSASTLQAAMKEIYIAQVTVGSDDAKLTAYFPIPIRANKTYTHIDGATQIIYLSDGAPVYYKGPYKLFTNTNEIETDLQWNIVYVPTIVNASENKEEDNPTRFFPALKVSNNNTTLTPLPAYVQNVCNCAIVASKKFFDSSGTTIVRLEPVWQQPLLILRNQYPSRVINKWDGKSLELNDDEGYILSNAIAAGKKDEGNTFTGVMIGDWSGTIGDSSISSTTGVYGFHQGAMAYAFKDDGTAFIGKDGSGRIEFNGTSSIIKDSGNNMTINLNEGIIDAKRFQLTAGAGDNKIELQTLDEDKEPLIIGNNLKVDWNGHLTARSGEIGNWELEQVETKKGADDSTYSTGGRLYSNITPTTSSTDGWGAIYLDPINNTIEGGKFKASILESDSGTIKLGGTISVYDPARKADIFNPHTGETEEQIDYSPTKYEADGKTPLTGKNNGGILGGTLGFVRMNSSSDSDYGTTGIGLQAENGGVVKATSNNVGMSIGSNYLFLTPETFQIKTYGTSAASIADDDDDTSTSTATSTLKFDGNGLAVDSNMGKLIIQTSTIEGDGPHVGMAYGTSSYLACYEDTSLLAANSNVELRAENIICQATSTVEIGKVKDDGTTVEPDTTLYGKLTVGKLQEGSMTSDITPEVKMYGSLDVAQNSVFQNVLTVGQSDVNSSYIFSVYSATGATSYFDTGVVFGGGITSSAADSNLIWSSGSINFTGVPANRQIGIYARFA